MLYMAKLPCGTIIENKLYKTKATLPLDITYEYFELNPATMEVSQISIRDIRTNKVKTRKMLERNLAHWEATEPSRWRSPESIAAHIEDVKKLIEIFS